MKNLSLGRVGQILIIATLLINFLNAADVKAKVDKEEIYSGDIVNFSIEAQGDKIEFPDIKQIANYPILQTSNSFQTIIVNSNVSKIHTRIYSFSPEKNVTIPSFKVVVDGQEFRTNPIKIKVIKPSSSLNGAPYVLLMVTNKDSSYVGEPIRLDIKFKIRRDIRAQKLGISQLNLENFWIKDLGDFKDSLEGNYIVKTKSYQLFPQKDGNFTIPPIVGQIGIAKKGQNSFFNDPFFMQFNNMLDWRRVRSNAVKINVKPLPNNLEIFGNYTISAKVDKTKVYANKPVNLTIKIEGYGNIDDIKKFNISLPDAIIYADDPKIDSFIKNGKYYGTFTQKIAIIADRNYTIPSIEFKFFDGKEVKTIKTKPIKIEVIGGNSSSDSIKVVASNIDKNATKTKIVYKKSNSWLNLIIGFILGIFTTLIFTKFKFKPKKEELPISKAIKKAKNDKELYNLLLPYLNEGEFIKEVINKLEENIYKKTHHKINKQDIIDYLEEINISS